MQLAALHFALFCGHVAQSTIDINQYFHTDDESISKVRQKYSAHFEDEQNGKPPKKLTSQEIYQNLKTNLASIKESCGEICDTSERKGDKGRYFDQISKKVNCQALFENHGIDTPGQFDEPPMRIPKWLYHDYGYNGQVQIDYYYRDDSKGSTHFSNWTMEMFETLERRINEGTLHGFYGRAAVEEIEQMIDSHFEVKDKHILVLGSQSPWIEMILLSKGAKKVTSVDYVKIASAHPKIEVMTTFDMNEKYLQGTLPLFDGLVSYSSLEHSGLGRYGDSLNPWGDLIGMAKSWCILKPRAKALIGVPSGPDKVIFNSHRIYGPLMYAHLFANWNQVYSDLDFSLFSQECDYCYQPTIVVEKRQ